MHVHATVAGVEILVVGVEMHARARATGKATPAAIYSYSRNALPVLVRDGSTADLLASIYAVATQQKLVLVHHIMPCNAVADGRSVLCDDASG